MASVECTERRTTEYRVPAWIRVRQEDFGLLFYDTRTTNLTFVRSAGNLIHRSILTSGQRESLVLAGAGKPEVQRALDKLVAKGLLEEHEGEGHA